MTACIFLRIRVNPGRRQESLHAHHNHQQKIPRLRSAGLITTGDRGCWFIGECDGVTEALCGEMVAQIRN